MNEEKNRGERMMTHAEKIIVSCFFLLPIIAGPLDIQAAEQTTAGMTK